MKSIRNAAWKGGSAAALSLAALVYAAPARADSTVVVCEAALAAPPSVIACAGVGVLLHEFILSDRPFGPNGELRKIILAPVNIVDGNFKGAYRESGEFAKVLRVVIGISAQDIGRYGIFGGPNSIFRKPFG
ncbi:hypothetical protein [Rhizobium leguminosarum]|uniref:hypothetical protein n=1 Tax=Rhizobium leguminosarum TaxID=384 RepID=UPI0012FB1D39|nr:hypothetical protein [Rhizobium leguminosarum]